jgi:hypothetical protein
MASTATGDRADWHPLGGKMRRSSLMLLIISFALLALAPFASAAAAIDRASSTIVLDGRYANPCGEVVDLTGTARVTFIRVTDAGGNTHFVSELTYQGAGGVGEETGLKYRAVSSDHFAYMNFDGAVGPLQAPAAATSESMLRFVSQGATSDFVLRQTFHMTVSATGEITSFFFESSIVCT